MIEELLRVINLEATIITTIAIVIVTIVNKLKIDKKKVDSIFKLIVGTLMKYQELNNQGNGIEKFTELQKQGLKYLQESANNRITKKLEKNFKNTNKLEKEIGKLKPSMDALLQPYKSKKNDSYIGTNIKAILDETMRVEAGLEFKKFF